MMPRLSPWVGAALVIAAAATPLRAQALPPPGDTDLTVPPDMRTSVSPQAAARPQPTAQPSRDSARRHRDTRESGRIDAKAAPKPVQDTHPVELGVTMRGGSGTSRVYAPSGQSEAIQEGGSAFGAGMKFGF